MSVRILIGDVRAKLADLPDESVHCVVTSPPYFGLRDYGTASWEGGDPACEHKQGREGIVPGSGGDQNGNRNRDGVGSMGGNCKRCGATRTDKQIGLEPTPAEFVAVMVGVFREVRRVLRKDGTCWVNLGDSYASGGRGGGGSYMAERKDAAWQSRGDATGWRSPPEGLKHKDLIGIPWRVAFALQADGWYLRQDIIWAKPNPMPESVTDRCTKAHEYLFLLSKSARYHYDAGAISEPLTQSSIDRLLQPNLENQEGSWRVPGKTNGAMKAKRRKPQGWNTSANYHNADPRYKPREEAEDYVAPVESDRRNKRSVWTVATQPFKEAHFATFPPDLIEPCIKAGCPKGGTVLDPFGGAGTTGLVADRLQRNAILIELNPEYAEIARARLTGDAPLFAEVA